ncbi:MAG: gluconeogenesis factor YvcK family protein, partial [Candidatus Rokuibacteriota bacterium]
MFPKPGAALSERERERLTAIVTVADDGGSSGRLRQAYGVLPPGDIRNCLLALADRDSTLAALFDYRFEGGDEIGGHSLGNLILTALSRLEHDFPRAIERGSQILGVRGRVFPSTTQAVRLRAQFDDGTRVEGESRIPSVAGIIRRVSLEPPDPGALAQAVEAALYADLIVIGPGSLYTSLIPVLLVKQLTDAIKQSHARVVLVMNLTT